MRRNVSEDGEAKLMSYFLSGYRVQLGTNRISRGCGGAIGRALEVQSRTPRIRKKDYRYESIIVVTSIEMT
jgi:hypothetical protein